MIPEVKIRDELVDRIHGKLLHRGVESVYYNLKLKYYWPGMKEFIREKLKKCEICEVNNRKNKMGYEFVATSRKMEKFAIDIVNIETEGKFVFGGHRLFFKSNNG